MADRIVVMNHGVIEQVGTPADIYRRPASLFVADFIGETNKFETTIAGGQVQVGGARLKTTARDFAEGAPVTVAIRPEDILPHSADHPEGENRIPVTIHDMEFLGSYWRTHLKGAALGEARLVANFSMNAVRRLGLDTGETLNVELPAERVLAFARKV